MTPERPRSFTARLIAAGLLLWAASALAGPGPMQVEEPGLSGSNPPIEPEKDQASWKEKKNASLTPDQKAALKNRQQTMKDMMILIQQKRRALREARPEDRRALAQELHNLILEKAQEAERGRDYAIRKGEERKAGKGDPEGASVDASARVREAPPAGNPDKKIRQHEQWEEIQRQQELRRRALEEKLKQQESRNNGNGNGNGNDNANGNGNGNGHGNGHGNGGN